MVFRKRPSESPDAQANRLQREGKADELEKELQRYSVAHRSENDKESYFHLWGITASRRRDHSEAFWRFKERLETCPDSQNLLFSLGQEYEHRRDIRPIYQAGKAAHFVE